MVCLYDYLCECNNDCEDCVRYFPKCSVCDAVGRLYDIGSRFQRELICEDCLISSNFKTSDFLEDFAAQNERLYGQFIVDLFSDCKI